MPCEMNKFLAGDARKGFGTEDTEYIQSLFKASSSVISEHHLKIWANIVLLSDKYTHVYHQG